MRKKNILSFVISISLLSPGTVLAINDTNSNEGLENSEELVSSQDTNDSTQTNEELESSNELISFQDTNNSEQVNEEIEDEELAKEYENQSGIDSIENVNNKLARYLSSSYTRTGNYVVHGNDDNVYYAYNRVGTTFYLNNGGISTTYKRVSEIIDVDTAVQTHVATSLFKEPAYSNKYYTGKTVPAGYYTAKHVAGSFVYVETDYGDGWISTSCDNAGNYVSGGRMTFIDVPSSLSVGSVKGIPIYQKIIPRYSSSARAGYSMKPKYITIHNTGSTGRGANARAHANLQYNGNSRAASWHYTVDNTEIWQSIPINENSWHAGDGQAMGNCGSVSIEICENSDGNYAQAERNAAYLTARLLYECGLPSDAVRMHRDWSGKDCPYNMINGKNGTMGWQSFKSLVATAYNSFAQNDRNTSNVVNQGTGKTSSAPTIQYTAKSQKIGWQGQVTEPNSAGTTGRSLKLYQMKINLLNVPNSTHLYGTVKTALGTKEYSNIENDTLIGIDGKSMTQVNFGLENVPGYHLEYHVHSSNLGWQSWTKQGNNAGDGKNEIQAIDFRLVKDDSVKVTLPKVFYNGHIAEKGWLPYVPDSQIAGTVGKSIYLQAFHLGIDNTQEYSLSGKVFVDGIGWKEYNDIKSDTVLGTTGQSRAIKAINLDLDLPGYRLEYQAHSSNIGWQDWVKSGQKAGDEKNNIEAIRFRIVEDNSKIIKIDFDSSELDMYLNSSYQLNAKVTPENTTMGKTLSWKSDNEDVVKVDQNGKLTANKVGSAIITATSVNGVKGICKINVIKPISHLKLDQTEVTIEKKEELPLGLTIEPQDATDSYTWKSSNNNVATVDQNGKVKAVGGGDATITVKSKNGIEATCKVHVLSHIESVLLDKTEIKLEKNTASSLHATINPTDVTDDKTLTWSSDDENVAKVDKNGNVTGVGLGTTDITVTTSNGKSATCKVTIVKQIPSVNYSTHVQDIGWQGYVENGNTAGTIGKSKRLEAIKIKLSKNTEYKGTIQYQTHIQDIGWQEWKTNDELSGTSGQSKRLEAIRIKLTDELAKNYDIYYRVHAQNFGWLGWAKNGESAGTAGYSYRLEAIQIKFVEKDEKAPESTQEAFRQRYVSYQTHVQDIGWQEIKYDGDIAGTSGQSKRLEAINISLSNPLYSGSIEYQTHVQDIGWQGWKTNGELSGTNGKSKRLEAIRIRLTGEMKNKYDIYYRVHAQNFGWLGWAKNGDSSGTEGYSYRLEAIQIQLVEKGNGAPGSEGNSYYKK